MVEQVEKLEDEAQPRQTIAGKRGLTEVVDANIVHQHLSLSRAIQAGDQVEQSRFAAARLPHHCDKLARWDADANIGEGSLARSSVVDLADIGHLDEVTYLVSPPGALDDMAPDGSSLPGRRLAT